MQRHRHPPAHRHALIALLACEVKRSGAVIVGGVHHGASGNQEVDEGCLPYGTQGLLREKESEDTFQTLSVKPRHYFTLFLPGMRRAQMYFSAREEQELMSSQTLQVQGTSGVALAGDIALVHILATEGRRKEPKKIPRVHQFIGRNTVQPLRNSDKEQCSYMLPSEKSTVQNSMIPTIPYVLYS